MVSPLLSRRRGVSSRRYRLACLPARFCTRCCGRAHLLAPLRGRAHLLAPRCALLRCGVSWLLRRPSAIPWQCDVNRSALRFFQQCCQLRLNVPVGHCANCGYASRKLGSATIFRSAGSSVWRFCGFLCICWVRCLCASLFVFMIFSCRKRSEHGGRRRRGNMLSTPSPHISSRYHGLGHCSGA